MLKACFLFQSEHFVQSSLICIWIFVCICVCERDRLWEIEKKRDQNLLLSSILYQERRWPKHWGRQRGKNHQKEEFWWHSWAAELNQSWNHHTSILSAIVLLSRQLSLWISLPGAENILTDTSTILILSHIFLFQLFFLGVLLRDTHMQGTHVHVHTHTHTQRRSHYESARYQTIPPSQWLQHHTHSLLMPLACVHWELAFCHNPSENKAEGEH